MPRSTTEAPRFRSKVGNCVDETGNILKDQLETSRFVTWRRLGRGVQLPEKRNCGSAWLERKNLPSMSRMPRWDGMRRFRKEERRMHHVRCRVLITTWRHVLLELKVKMQTASIHGACSVHAFDNLGRPALLML